MKPNIVLLLTDDQDERSLAVAGEGIEQTLGASGGEGATFNRAVVTTPVCCTSRGALRQGAHVHQHTV